MFRPWEAPEHDDIVGERAQTSRVRARGDKLADAIMRLVTAGWQAVKDVLYYLLETYWVRKGAVLRVRRGPYRGLVFRGCEQLREHGRMISVLLRGEYEPDVTSFLATHLGPEARVLIAGSHIGIHVMFAARCLAGTGKVYAVEPWPDNFSELTANIQLNNFSNVVPIQAALSSTPGLLHMQPGADSGAHQLSHSTSPVEARVTTVDEIARSGEGSLDLVLLDVEGAELDVLRGAVETIAKSKPAFVIEFHGEGERQKLQDWLEDKGYVVNQLSRHISATPGGGEIYA